MLGRGSRHTSLAGKLLLSTALIAVSLAYGWWHRHNSARPNLSAMPSSAPPAAAEAVPAKPRTAQKPPDIAANMPAPSRQSVAAPAAPTAPARNTPPPISALASLRMYQPPPAHAPLGFVTGTPAPGAAPAIPAGTHLEDGDYLSDSEQYEWGDLQVKISVRGGMIRGAQIVQYPDHRAESLEISQMSAPLLCSELIKTQQAKVDIVSSATDTSYVFRDAVASALIKARR
jgi:uncharacterized protein with FMN-binding domain